MKSMSHRTLPLLAKHIRMQPYKMTNGTTLDLDRSRSIQYMCIIIARSQASCRDDTCVNVPIGLDRSAKLLNSDIRQKCSQQRLASGSGRQNDLIQFIGRLHASFRDTSNRKANIKCQPNNGKGDWKSNAGSKVPGGLLTGFTLKEAKEVE